MSEDKIEWMIKSFIRMVRIFQNLSDKEIYLIMKSMLIENQEETEELLRAFDIIKLKQEVKELRKSPQKYARKLP